MLEAVLAGFHHAILLLCVFDNFYNEKVKTKQIVRVFHES